MEKTTEQEHSDAISTAIDILNNAIRQAKDCNIYIDIGMIARGKYIEEHGVARVYAKIWKLIERTS